MDNVNKALPTSTRTLANVAKSLEQTGAQSVVIGSINAKCFRNEVLDQIERVLTQLQAMLEPKHPSLTGYVILTSHTDSDRPSTYDKYTISFDQLDKEAAWNLMSILPHHLFEKCTNEAYLNYDWDSLGAEEAIRQLRDIHEQCEQEAGVSLTCRIELYPFSGAKIQRPDYCRLAAHLGMRSTRHGIEVLAEA